MKSEKNECNCEQSLLLKEQLDYACKQYSNLLGQHVELEKWFKNLTTAITGTSIITYHRGLLTFEDGTTLKPPFDTEKKAETEVNDG